MDFDKYVELMILKQIVAPKDVQKALAAFAVENVKYTDRQIVDYRIFKES